MRLGNTDARAQSRDAFVGDATRLGQCRRSMRHLLGSAEYCTDRDRIALPDTIPERSRTRARHGSRRVEALVDEQRTAHVRRNSATRPATRHAGSSPRASQPGDRVAIWAPNIVGVGRSPRSASTAPVRVIVPVNTRFKGNEAAYILDNDAGRSCCSRSPTSSTPTTSRMLASRRPGAGARAYDRRPARRRTATGTTVVGRVPRGGRRRCRSPTIEARERAHHRRRPSPTSSSRRARPAGRRARCSRTARASRAYDAWTTVVGLREGDRYLIVNPFFHTFGLKAGILACLITGATIVPARGVRRRHGDAARRRGAHLDAPGRADDLPVDPRPSASGRVRHVDAAPRASPARRRCRSS